MNTGSIGISIILCTFERTADLLATLESIRHAELPDGMTAGLLVVDGSRTEDTRRALRDGFAPIPHLPLRVLHEPRRGKAHALNTALAASRGEILLFTDDDVRVPPDWIREITRPILADEADAVAGGVHLPPALLRPWMDPFHRLWMASTESLDPNKPASLIGANMAFSRRVLARVPWYDTELGAGSDLGGWDESLFSFQLREAGYRLATAFHASVEHHFDPTRLARKHFLERARIEGRSAAYVAYHWRHEVIAAPRLKLLVFRLKRWIKNGWFRPRWTAGEGAPEWELWYLINTHFLKQYLRERRRPRQYAKHGLVKRPEIA